MKKLLSIYKYINAPVKQRLIIGDLLGALPRIVCGVLLAFSFGSDKFGMPWSPADRNMGLFEVVYWFPQDVAEFGGIFAILPGFFAWMGAFSEAVGGLFLIAGFQTRIASFLLCCTMLVAIFLQKWGGPMWQLLPSMGFLWVAVYNLINGSGRIGMDYIVDRYLLEK